jgi:Cu(I)/Ag(I) efflux system membrane protein CusA/SilA
MLRSLVLAMVLALAAQPAAAQHRRPMVGGMVTAPLLSMFVIPAVYLLIRRRELRARPAQEPGAMSGARS